MFPYFRYFRAKNAPLMLKSVQRSIPAIKVQTAALKFRVSIQRLEHITLFGVLFLLLTTHLSFKQTRRAVINAHCAILRIPIPTPALRLALLEPNRSYDRNHSRVRSHLFALHEITRCERWPARPKGSSSCWLRRNEPPRRWPRPESVSDTPRPILNIKHRV